MNNKEISKYFKILSNPVRLSIFIEVLDTSCECDLHNKKNVSSNCVTHIAKSLKIPQPTVSNHVKELINVGILVSKRKGKNIYLFGSKGFLENLSLFTKEISNKY